MLAVLVLAAAPAGWSRLPSLPDKEGFAGAFAGTSNGALIVAGGANFPGKRPWEGGAKHFSDTVFVLDKPDGTWAAAAKLPRPLAHGVSVTCGNAVVCAGGADAARHYTDVFCLEWSEGKLLRRFLPELPGPVAYGCAALVAGRQLYVAGGTEKPDADRASATVYHMDLGSCRPRWTTLYQPIPTAGRMLAVAAGNDRGFWVAGGVELIRGADGKPERRYLAGVHYYTHADNKWSAAPKLPRPLAAGPSPAPADNTGFSILGGDTGADAKTPPDKHPGFDRRVLRCDGDRWIEAGETPAPRATVPCVPWHRSWVIPSGEVRPGVRSPDVWRFAPGAK